jgi:hypothetical protein
MITYTPEYEAVRRRWRRSLVVPVLLGVAGIFLFSRWGPLNTPLLPAALQFFQPVVNVLPLALWIGGIGGAILQTRRNLRCPECGTSVENGNKGACRNCGLSFGYGD